MISRCRSGDAVSHLLEESMLAIHLVVAIPMLNGFQLGQQCIFLFVISANRPVLSVIKTLAFLLGVAVARRR